VNEFKAMVRELHKAGLEVILDVVYNPTNTTTSMAKRAATARTTASRGIVGSRVRATTARSGGQSLV